MTSVVLALDTEKGEDEEQSRSVADAGGTLLQDLVCGKSEKILCYSSRSTAHTVRFMGLEFRGEA